MDTKEKDDSLLVFSLLKKNYNYLSYDALRRQVLLGTNLSFGKTLSELNKLIDHKTLQHSDNIPFYYRTNPHEEKKSLRDLYDPLVLNDPDISNALKGIYGISGKSASNKFGWNDFRTLVKYFIDVLKQENQQYYFDLNNVDIDFLFLTYLPKLVKLTSIDNRYETRLFPELEKCTALTEKKSNLSIGYPIEKITNKEGKEILYPIFYIPIESIKREEDHIVVKTLTDKPEINSSWLNASFKKKEDKYGFLAECGVKFFSQLDEEYSGNEYDIEDEGLSLERLLRALKYRYSSKLKQPIDSNKILIPDITLKEDGVYNSVVIGVSNSSNYVKSTIEELSYIGNCSDEVLNKTALKYLFVSKEEYSSESENSEDKNINTNGTRELYVDERLVFCGPETVNLNQQQKYAVSSILSEPLTVIQGPPGTGKSQVITSAAANLRLHNQTALISSKNHQAITSLMERSNFKIFEEDSEQLIKRFNDSESELFSFKKAAKEIDLRRESDSTSFDIKKKHFAVIFEKASKLIELENTALDLESLKESINDLACSKFMSAFSKYSENDSFKEIISTSTSEMRQQVERTARLSQLYGKSRKFLNPFAFIKKHKVNVVLKKLNADESLNQNNVEKITEFLFNWIDVSNDYQMVQDCSHNVDGLKEQGFKDIKDLMFKNMSEVNSYQESALSFLIDSIQNCSKATKAEIEKVKMALAYLSVFSEEQFFDLLAKPNDSSDSKSCIKDAFDVLMDKYPIIACSLMSMKRYFPLVPGFFDIAIIDEAGQSDFIRAIPAMFRAKRLAIVGDPKQLSHITNLNKNTEYTLMSKYNLDPGKYRKFSYIDNSLYELAALSMQANEILLDESYRSCQSITSYISRAFYGSQIQCASNELRSYAIPSRYPTTGIYWNCVKGHFERQEKSVFCPEEAEQIVEDLKKIFLDTSFEGNVGVIAPYRAQAVKISNLCEQDDELTSAISDGRLVIDTVHRFQGSERDCMIFSLCYDKARKDNSFVTDPNLMNVALSRAKALVIVVGDRESASKSGIHHLQLLASNENFNKNVPVYSELGYESPYEMKVGEALKELGYDIKVQYGVGKRRLDLALIQNGKKLDIEIDGCSIHKDSVLGIRKRDDYIRDLELKSRNFTVVRIWTSEIRADFSKCIDKIVSKWEELQNGGEDE